MPLFVIVCRDIPTGSGLRAELRDQHMAHVRSQPVSIKLAGPTVDETAAATGSIVVVEADDLPTVRSFVATDPYNSGGVYAQVEIIPWRVVVGRID
jgi:uncharacterized protein